MELQPFTPAGSTVSLAVTSASGRVALTQKPGSSAELTVILRNEGDAEIFVTFGDSTVTAAAATSMPIPSGSSMVFSVAATNTHVAAITASGTATLRATSGTGIPYGFGGSGAGGGSGSSDVNVAEVGGVTVPAYGAAFPTSGLPVAFSSSAGSTMQNGVVSPDGSLRISLFETGDDPLVADNATTGGTSFPIPIGGEYNTTLPTYANQDRTQAQFTVDGRLIVETGPYTPTRVTADAQIKASPGFIHTLSFSPTGAVTAGTITIYNNTAESGTQVFSFAAPATTFTPFSVTLDVACSTGIYVGYDGTVANVQTTVSWR